MSHPNRRAVAGKRALRGASTTSGVVISRDGLPTARYGVYKIKGPFQTNVVNVAVERDFYKLRDLADADIFLIRALMKDSPPPAKRVLENFISMFGMFGRLKTISLVSGDTKLLALIDREVITMEESFMRSSKGISSQYSIQSDARI